MSYGEVLTLMREGGAPIVDPKTLHVLNLPIPVLISPASIKCD